MLNRQRSEQPFRVADKGRNRRPNNRRKAASATNLKVIAPFGKVPSPDRLIFRAHVRGPLPRLKPSVFRTRQLAFRADELSLERFPLLLQPVGEDQSWRIVIRLREDRLHEV